MKKFLTALTLSAILVACGSAAPDPVATPEPTAAPTSSPQVASGTDPNPFTAAFAQAFCAQDAQGVYDSLANGSGIKNGLNGESAYYAQVIDQDTQGVANIIAEVGVETNTDVTAMLAAVDAKAANLKAQNSPVNILSAEIALSNGTTCAMTYKGSFTDKSGGYNAIYVITYYRTDGTSDGNFFIVTAGDGGVEDIQ